MALGAADLVALSRLLDEVMSLAPAQQESWFIALGPADKHLEPILRELLVEHTATGTHGRLSTLPKFEENEEAWTTSAGDLVGPYRILSAIGQGGMGTVWLAERADGAFKRQVALKLPRLRSNAGLAERVAREREIGALLEHPNIARLYDAGIDATGRPYIALEYIQHGKAIDEWCKENGLGVTDTLRLFAQVARAVAYAHGRLVVHRDLKPSNILVTPDGQPHLLDFGIAKLLDQAQVDPGGVTQEHGRVFTPHYASPEQIRGEPVNVASDVYSLGILLRELLTGQPPRAASRFMHAPESNAESRSTAVLPSGQALNKSTKKVLLGEINAIVCMALEPEPSRRYATADALAQDIERYLAGDAIRAHPDSLLYRLRKAAFRHRFGFAAGTATLLAVIVGAGVSLIQARRASDEAARATEAAERANAVKEFVVDVFRINARDAHDNGKLRELPAELILLRGARLIEAKFDQQPQLQAELFGVVADIFANMGSSVQATEFGRKHLHALIKIGAQADDQAKARILLARALARTGHFAESELEARGALAVAKDASAVSTSARLTLARVLLLQAKYPECLQQLDQVDVSLGDPGPHVASARVESAALRAAWLSRRNRFDEAAEHYKRAIDIATITEGELSRTAIDIRLDFTEELARRRRGDDAKSQLALALKAMRVLNGPGDIRAALAEARAAVVLGETYEIPLDEARRVVRRARETIVDPGGLPPSIGALFDLYLGQVTVWSGRIREGADLLTRARVNLGALSNDPWLQLNLASALGYTSRYLGNYREAVSRDREALELAKLVYGPADPETAWYYAELAAGLSEQGRYGEAREILENAPKIEPFRGVPAYAEFGQHTFLIALARIRLQEGDPSGALELLPKVEMLGPYRFTDYRSVQGQALCELGRSVAGLALLEAHLSDVAEQWYEYDPDIARVRGVAGLCALKAGKRKRAMELADLAHEAFLNEPKVAAYFRRPSELLARALQSRRITSARS